MPLADLLLDLFYERVGKPAEIQLNSSGVVDKSFLDFLRRTTTESREVLPPTLDTWYRISGLGYLCLREEVLAGVLKKTRITNLTPDEIMNYSLGSGWHFVMQNEFLGPHGILFGKWECWRCHRIGGTDLMPVLRPQKCSSCGGDRFLYEEIIVENSEYKIRGHLDGVVDIGGVKRLLELKTINEHWFKHKVDMAPLPAHIVQATMYMWATGLREALIVYYNKNGYGLRGIRTYEVEYDRNLALSILSNMTTIKYGLKNGVLPARSLECANQSTARAKSCAMVNECFSCNDKLDVSQIAETVI